MCDNTSSDSSFFLEKTNAGSEESSLLKAIGSDRSNYSAYLDYSKLLVKHQRFSEAIICLKEAFRLVKAPEPLKELLRQIESNSDLDNAALSVYREKIGENPIPPALSKLKIIVVTNLLPPQEMGGFGRTVWEFCDLLIKRGHDLRILCANLPNLTKSVDADHIRMEGYIQRDLRLFGDWKDGRAVSEKEPSVIRDICFFNYRRIMKEIESFHPDVCMVGNLDFLGSIFLKRIAEQNIPVLHRLGNANPGYPVEMTPDTDAYCLAGCSHWLNNKIKEQGYPYRRYAVVFPGSPLEKYFKAFSPQLDKLRICFASLLMPYKGAQILIDALALLKKINIPFTCEIAGDTTVPAFVEALKQRARDADFLDQIQFTGFLNKKELSNLYARSNVMVFPSVFDEPFGKSQIEAMAAGLCVISSGTGGSREIVRDEENGLVFKSQDAEDLARKLFILNSDKKMWAKLALQGQQDAFCFTTLNSVLKIENEFNDMLCSV